VEPAAVETASVESTAMKPAKPAAMKSATAVETATTAMPAAPPPWAASATSGWQRTAAPSNAAAMLIRRHVFLGRDPLLPDTRIDYSFIIPRRQTIQ